MVVLLVSLAGYTLAMQLSEPHPSSPTVVTSRAYALDIANRIDSIPASLSYHTFTLSGAEATYGFSLAIYGNPGLYYNNSLENVQYMIFTITEVNNTQGFPYFGTFLLEPITAFVTLNVDGHTYYSENSSGTTGYLRFPYSGITGNSSVSGYQYFYDHLSRKPTV